MREDSIYQGIKKALLQLGWRDEDLLFEPVIYIHNRIYRPDIVLLYNLFPFAIIEIKRNLDQSHSAILNAKERAKEQAKTLEVPFAITTDGIQTVMVNVTNEESQTLTSLPKPEYLWELMGREWSLSDPRLFPPFWQENKNFLLHQAIAISRAIETIISGKRQVLLTMGTGTGKSWVLFQIAWKLIQSRYYQRMLYLANSIDDLNQARKVFEPFDQNLFIIDRVHPANNHAQAHLASMSQLYTSKTSHYLSSLPSNFYDIIFLQSVQREKSSLPILEHFSTAVRIAIDDIGTSKIPLDYGSPIFTYTVNDVLETEYAYPPSGFTTRRLDEIAQIRIGRKPETDETNSSITSSNYFLVTPKDILVDGSIQQDTESIFTEDNIDEQLILKPDDILVSRFITSSQIKIALIPGDLPGNITFDHRLIKICVNRTYADPKVVYKFLKSDSGHRLLRLMVSGATIPQLSIQSIAQMPIFLPERAKIEDEDVNLSDAAWIKKEIIDRILPLLEQSEQGSEQNTADQEDAPNLYTAINIINHIITKIVPPSLTEQILTKYPTPIALTYRRFQDTQFDVYQQLFRLRDIFESTMYFIYHIILADMLRYLDPRKYFIKNKGLRQAYDGYSMASRINFVSEILQIASEDKGLDLFIPELVELTSVLSEAHDLQKNFRNPLSHTTIVQEAGAKKMLEKFQPNIERILAQLAFLEYYPLAQISSFRVRQKCWVRRMIVYKGVVPYSNEEQLSTSSIFPSPESDHLVLLKDEDKLLDLYPLYQLVTNEKTQFETHICVLKQQINKQLEGESIQGAFTLQMNGYDILQELQKNILDKNEQSK